MKKNHNFYKSINISAFIKNILILCIFYFFTFQSSYAQLNNDKLKNDKIDKDKLTEQLNNKPFTFMENKGQWPEEVLFMANTKSLRAWITKKAMVFEQFEENKNASNNPFEDTLRNKEIKTHVTGLEFVNPKQVKVQKFNPIITKYNFLIGNDESKHAKDVAAYENVKAENIYEGIDMKYYFDNGELRYDYIVKPNADPNQIELEIKGGDSFRIVNGELIIETSLNPVIKKELFAYQNDKLDKTKKNKVNSEFTLNGNKLKFNIGNYDKSQELIIDPLTSAGIFRPNNRGYIINDLHIDHNNYYYCVGSTISPKFPGNYYSLTIVGGKDVVLSMCTSNYTLLMTTFIGGVNDDEGTAIETGIYSNSDYIYITGFTKSSNFPVDNVNNNFYNNNLYGDVSTFFSVFEVIDNTGSFSINKLYSTYLKNSNTSQSYLDKADIKVNNNGTVYISTNTNTSITPSFVDFNQITTQNHSSSASNIKGCLYGFHPYRTGTILNYNCIFSSLFSGDNFTTVNSLDIDNYNNLYIGGISKGTASSINLTSNSYKNTQTTAYIGYKYVYLTKLNFNINLNILYNSILFEETVNTSEEIQVNDVLYYNNRIVIAGSNHKDNNLAFVNAFDNTRSMINSSKQEAYLSVIELNSQNTNDLVYSSYFGGTEVNNKYIGSVINDLDYDPVCDKIIFIGTTISELTGFQGTLDPYLAFYYLNGQNTYNSLVGSVKINLTGVNTLFELGYDIADGFVQEEFGKAVVFNKMDSKLFCFGQGNEFVMFRDYNVENCTTECPCPINKDSWLSLTGVKGESPCSADECKVFVSLDLPQEYQGCFSHFSSYSYELGMQIQDIPKQLISNFDFTSLSKCIIAGSTYRIHLKLYRSADDNNPCIIIKEFTCPVSVSASVSCTPDCLDDPWFVRDPLELNINCGGEICKLIINYATRIACDGAYQDVQITSIDKVNLNGNSTNACALCNDADVFKAAFEEIVSKNVMGFMPQSHLNPCNITWRLSMASCWAKWLTAIRINTPAGTSPQYLYLTKYRPCNSSCCVRKFKVCRLPGGGVDIIDLGLSGTAQSCEGINFNNHEIYFPCTFMCDVMGNINSKISVDNNANNFNFEEYEKLLKNEVFMFNYHNDNNNLYLNIENNKLDNLEIKIYDLLGNVVSSHLFNKSQFTKNLNIDISNLISNMYMFEILTDNTKLFDGKFIKIKE